MSRRYFPKLKGADARTLAFLTLYQVFEEGAYTNLALQGVFNRFQPPALTRSTVTAMVQGTLARSVTADFILNQRLSRKMERLQPAVRTVLRLAVWELLWSNNQNKAAVTNEACLLAEATANRGAVSLVNAVLRGILREPVNLPTGDLGIRTGLIPELAGLFKKWYGETAPALLEALALPPPLVVRARPGVGVKTGVPTAGGAVFKPAHFMPQAYFLELGECSVAELPAFKAGEITVQGEASMLPATLSGLTAGGLAWDMCAAPGSKTLQLAEQVGPTGLVIAGDIHVSRLGLLQKNRERFRLAQIKLLEHDATAPLPAGLTDRVDAVLTDVPCSGLGRLASRPELRFRMTYDKITGLYPLQHQILCRAGEAVRPGGRLIYSTCTLNPAENEEQVEVFLTEHKDFEALDITDLLPQALLDIDPLLQQTAECGRVTLSPDRHGCEGFFVAVMERKR